MKIEVGQDAMGRWAWMIKDAAGRLVASDDNYFEAELAMEAALGQLQRRKDEDRHEARRKLRAVR